MLHVAYVLLGFTGPSARSQELVFHMWRYWVGCGPWTGSVSMYIFISYECMSHASVGSNQLKVFFCVDVLGSGAETAEELHCGA